MCAKLAVSEKVEVPGLVRNDPWLKPFEKEIIGRINRYEKRLGDINAEYGSLEGFTEAYKDLGLRFVEQKGVWVYREWAPEAYALNLIGDFNDWNRESHPLRKTEGGIWEIKLKEAELPENSRLKVHVRGRNGLHDRIPAYAHRVVQDAQTADFAMEAFRERPFEWTDGDFSAKKAKAEPIIYEAHIGMASEDGRVADFEDFRRDVLPRIASLGYNTIQLMAVMEHPYYGSFGYHVSNFFAVSSRFGTPDDFRRLVNEAHSLGIAIIIDLVHSHSVKNFAEGLNQFDGTEGQYFHPGGRGYHLAWDSMLFNYGKPEVLRFLLSNVRYWLEEYHLDGFRFDGVTSLLYFHHGDHISFDSYEKYFEDVDWDAITYLQLASTVAHQTNPDAIIIAEDMSGMPGLCRPVSEGGFGFDFRLAMGIPDYWIKMLKEKQDDDWRMGDIWHTLTNRRAGEAVIAYAESHDQAIVGDKTLAFWLMDKEMYTHMNKGSESLVIDRGVALHKMIRLISATLGGEGYLTFMGNEFGHPEWIDFPREGNNWSHHYARRQWSLARNPFLKYIWLDDFDKAMVALLKKYEVFEGGECRQLNVDEKNHVLIYERAGLVFAFNFHPERSVPDYEFWVPKNGAYKVVLSSDHSDFGGHNRVDTNLKYGVSVGSKLSLYLPNRTVVVLENEPLEV
ncbi:1,4-alpha-glucan branching enzyme [Fulvitalea axinellae]|uniref:1,4-alpha-glucan branching enzyme n=1 Tax=Fulvitalea axinellae TaxID=1182444 RepID=A0AAU9CPX2_9BACT|nr:1,4-alpha-glucan branching enzyme [Fulvitalea axinellae]